ncbi:Geraniol 8-hydroxylase [Capsicum annuum]|nr:Geraniol 8-hydroxylase [Capsicum annuum]
MHLLGAKPHVSLANLAKTYGPVMSLKLGQLTTVVISSSSMAKQVLKNQDQTFSGRFVPNAVQAHNYCEYSVVWIPVCPEWRKLRRIMNTNIFSCNRLDANQHLRSQKVKELIAYCEKCSQEGKVVDIGEVAFKTNLNLMSNTLFSKDLADPFSDSKVELKDVICSIVVEVGKPNLVDFFPILEKIDPQGVKCRATIYFGKLFRLFDDLIKERLEERRRGDSVKSVMSWKRFSIVLKKTLKR